MTGDRVDAEVLVVLAHVSDPNDAVEDLTITIVSDQQEPLDVEMTIADGFVQLELADLVPGEHVLTVQAVDPMRSGAEDSVTITAMDTDVDDDGYRSYEAGGLDCNDQNPSVHPNADELCNGLDDDCDESVDEDSVDAPEWYIDGDKDNYGAQGPIASCWPTADQVAQGGDCDDGNDAVNPAASEVCNGLDDDCDGRTDDDALDAGTYFADVDADGFGDAYLATVTCFKPADHSATSGDCDDGEPTIYPGAAEYCNGVDDDCDGLSDESYDVVNATTWFADTDADGFGDVSAASLACDAPLNHVSDATDCDDADGSVYPGADEVCDGIDNNCSGVIDESGSVGESLWYADADADGYGNAVVSTLRCVRPTGYAKSSADCDDTDDDVHPAATELCNGVDDDCDGHTDEGAVDALTWFADGDVDGFGDPLTAKVRCEQPKGYVSDDQDCDDAKTAVHPAADEVCDGIDNDCDGMADGANHVVDAKSWHADSDGDGFGDAAGLISKCSAPAGYVADDTDCDDGSDVVYPGAEELCDGLDNNCSGQVDEMGATGAQTWYADTDGDGYGHASVATSRCVRPAGYATSSTDCDDTDFDVNPTADELCNGIDDDCDSDIDEDDALDAKTWYLDHDGDHYGLESSVVVSCTQPAGYVSVTEDCDDDAVDVFPGADEICDDLDNDCDGTVDGASEVIDATYWYADSDADGFGDASADQLQCVAPLGYVADDSDCDDDVDVVYPGAEELCDGLDNNCSGQVDEVGATGAQTWYADVDDDGYGNGAAATQRCVRPTGYSSVAEDCDDTVSEVNPSASEICNLLDDDCDGDVDGSAVDADTWYADADEDGYGDAATGLRFCDAPLGRVADGTDCDDQQDTVFPGGPEICDGLDNDCDGDTDEGYIGGASTFYEDLDGDGYGTTATTIARCTVPTGYANSSTDCDDGDDTVHPGADEWCDAVDQDCDGDPMGPNPVDADLWYTDADEDGFGDPATAAWLCEAVLEVANGEDCDDVLSAINPDATEVCDGKDNDCSGQVDGADATDASEWVPDRDGDTYGDEDPTLVALACEAPTEHIEGPATDCDDTRGDVHPGASDAAYDGIDANCDGETDYDDDGDGYVSADYGGEDCDDTTAWNSPDREEVYGDGVDNDCDGLIDNTNSWHHQTITGMEGGSHIAIDTHNGIPTVAMQAHLPTGGNAWITTANFDGSTWSAAPVRHYTHTPSTRSVDLSLDSAGLAQVVWTDQDVGAYQAAQAEDGGFGSVHFTSGKGNYSNLAAVDVAPDDVPYVVSYLSWNHGYLTYARGGPGSTLSQISSGHFDAVDVAAHPGPYGLMAIAAKKRNSGLYVYRIDGSGTVAQELVTANTASGRHVSAEYHHDGSLHLVYGQEGEVVHAWDTGAGWEFETLYEAPTGTTTFREVNAVFDAFGELHLTACFALATGGGTVIYQNDSVAEEVTRPAPSTDNPLQCDVAVEDDGRVHVVWYTANLPVHAWFW
jgi:large repetitive protein